MLEDIFWAIVAAPFLGAVVAILHLLFRGRSAAKPVPRKQEPVDPMIFYYEDGIYKDD